MAFRIIKYSEKIQVGNGHEISPFTIREIGEIFIQSVPVGNPGEPVSHACKGKLFIYHKILCSACTKISGCKPRSGKNREIYSGITGAQVPVRDKEKAHCA